MDDETYQGLIGKTRIGTTIYTCECGSRFGTKIYLSLNTSERPDLVDKATSGKLNAVVCNRCKKKSEVPAQYIYHDPDRKYFLLIVPKQQRHLEIAARANLLKEIAETPSEVVPDYVVNFACVFGSDGLKDFLQSPPPGAGMIQEEIEKLKKLDSDVKDRAAKVNKKEDTLLQKESSLDQKENMLFQKEQSIVTREMKLRERGEKITEIEDILQEKQEDLEQKTQELNIFASQLKQWEARLKERRQSSEDFSKILEEETKKTKSPVEAPSKPKPRVLTDTKPETPPWFPTKGDEASPSLSSSIEMILPGEKEAMEISETDVIEEADIINEADIIDEKPIVPIPLKEAPVVKRVMRPDKKKMLAIESNVKNDLLSDRGRSVSLKNDVVSLWATTSKKDLLEDLNPEWMKLRCHMFNDEGGFPWIILTLTIRHPKAGSSLFSWFFNLKYPENYRIIKFLEKKFEARVNLVSEGIDKIASEKVHSDLTSNLKQIIDDVENEIRADKSLQPDKKMDKEKLLEQLLDEQKKPFPFHSKYFPDSASVGKTLEAIRELAEWSKPQMRSTAVRVYSYPIGSLNDIKTRALKTAIGYGIFIPEILWKEGPALGLVSSKRDTLNSQIQLFAKLCREGNDLDRETIKANWRQLLAEAKKISLQVGPSDAIAALNYIDESYFDQETLTKVNKNLDVDIDKADNETLKQLLAVNKKKTDALLEILFRSEKELFDDVVNSVMDMDARQLNKVLPAISETDDLGETLLMEGLVRGRREVKLACAAFLGKQKLRSAIVPLIKLMLESGEPDWKFVAWLLTGYGISGVRTIEQFVRDPRGQEEKIIYLLSAFIIMGQNKQVEKFTGDSNLLVRSLIKKSMEMTGEIADDEENIRKQIIKELSIDIP